MELLQKKVWLVVSSFCVLDQNIGQSENGEQLEYFCDLRIKIFPFRFHAFSFKVCWMIVWQFTTGFWLTLREVQFIPGDIRWDQRTCLNTDILHSKCVPCLRTYLANLNLRLFEVIQSL